MKSTVRARLGAQELDETSQNTLEIEEFLAGLCFKQKNKVEGLAIDRCKFK